MVFKEIIAALTAHETERTKFLEQEKIYVY
jgi:hypothetical protein